MSRKDVNSRQDQLAHKIQLARELDADDELGNQTMTEEEWFATDDLHAMCKHLGLQPHNRKLRLLLIAAMRKHKMLDRRCVWMMESAILTGSQPCRNAELAVGCPFRFGRLGSGPEVLPVGRVTEGAEFDQRADVLDAPPRPRALQP